MDAYLHLEALSSSFRSFNHDLLRKLNNPLLAYRMHKCGTTYRFFLQTYSLYCLFTCPNGIVLNVEH